MAAEDRILAAEHFVLTFSTTRANNQDVQMPIPDYQSLMLPVLLASSNGEARIGAVVEELADQLGLSPEERSELLPSGKQTVFSNRVHWAKTYLAQAGLIENTRRGHFAITLRGRQTLASHLSHRQRIS